MKTGIKVHLNGDLLAAVDTETTGLNPTFHEIIQIAVIPLSPDTLEPVQNILPFITTLRPDRPQVMSKDALRVNQITPEMLAASASQEQAADAFIDWFNALPLAPGKRLVPIAHNWPFDKQFISNWLGHGAYESCFSGLFRDTMSLSCFANDRSAWYNDQAPFSKVKLTWMAYQFGVRSQGRAHDAVADALMAAGIYKAFLTYGFQQHEPNLLPSVLANCGKLTYLLSNGGLSEVSTDVSNCAMFFDKFPCVNVLVCGDFDTTPLKELEENGRITITKCQ